MSLYVTRHGETVFHAENRYAGVTDVALTDRGMEQAERLGEWARRTGIQAVWASPLSRARITAAAAGMPVQIDDELAEVDFGAVEGRTLAEMPEKEVAAFLADPVAGAFEGAEDPLKAGVRGAAALRRIALAHPSDKVLVVAHSTLVRLALCELIGIPSARYRRVLPKLGNCTITELSLTGDPALITYNAPLP